MMVFHLNQKIGNILEAKVTHVATPETSIYYYLIYLMII